MDSTYLFLLGCLVGGLLVTVVRGIVINLVGGKTSGKSREPLYGVEHCKLNLTLPPQSMWMNMGYWEDTKDFPTACRRLLEKVLASARVFHEPSATQNDVSVKTLTIIDAGFGCGDQCLYFSEILNEQTFGQRTKHELKAYVGVTLDPDQFRMAAERLGSKHADNATSPKIYCADAANPSSWTAELRDSIATACLQNEKESGTHENWFLALDTLYHFRPTRWPIINYARSELAASFMAYDLCVADDLSSWQRIALRIISVVGQTPFANWTTVQEYRDRLIVAGYSQDSIEIHDVSSQVFNPLADFLRRQDLVMQRYGLSIGRFRHAAALFDWWGRSGIIRGCIIIARHNHESRDC